MRYKIPIKNWLVKDVDSVKFHVKNNDYFGTIATLLELIRVEIKKDEINKNKIEKTLLNIKRDFMFLQEKYKITNK